MCLKEPEAGFSALPEEEEEASLLPAMLMARL